jgi:hypothetical protein
MAGSAAAAAGLQGDLATFAPLLARDNPEMAAAVMLSANLSEKDPEQRPMLGWKIGKDGDGKPIWQATDRHDEYYRLRFGVTGLRPDVSMLAVKSSRGLTDCCLLPPRIEVSAILGPQPETEDGADAAAAAADKAMEPPAAAGGKVAGGGINGAVGVKRAAADGAAGGSSPDKRRLVLSSQQQQQQAKSSGPANIPPSKLAAATTAAAAPAAPAADCSHSLEKVDRLAEWEQQQQQDAFGGLTQAQLDEAGKRLAAMSSSARRKVCLGWFWVAQHVYLACMLWCCTLTAAHRLRVHE